MTNNVNESSTCSEISFESIPPHCHWVFADEAILLAIRHKRPVKRGTRGSSIRKILMVSGYFGLSMLVLILIGIVQIITLYVREIIQKRIKSSPTSINNPLDGAINVFIGFGARAEEALLDFYRLRTSNRIFRIDQCNLVETAWVGIINPMHLIQSFFSSILEVNVATNSLPNKFNAYKIELMTSASIRFATYVYARAWWRSVRMRYKIEEACFLSADLNAFAAISENVKSLYLQHGLISRNLLLPGFNTVLTLTRYEQNYLKRMLPNAAVHHIREMKASDHIDRNPCIIVASGNRTCDEMSLVVPLLEYFIQLGVEIHIKLFKGEALSRYWGSLSLGSGFKIEAYDVPFGKLVEELRPMFVASWGSTALVDALYFGIIPICVANLDDELISETLFPLFQCCLKWPEQRDEIQKVFFDSMTYSATLERLRQVDQ